MSINEHSAAGLKKLLLIQLALAILSLLVPWTSYPTVPPTTLVSPVDEAFLPPPSSGDESILTGVARAFTHPSTALVLISCGSLNGLYTAWQAVLPIVYKSTAGFTDHDGVLLDEFSNCIAVREL